jgi:hypothetical protein
MALEDFLGETSEIKIVDFLAENRDISYNQTQISEFTGLSRTTVNQKIPEMIQNNILEIKEELGMLKTYQLADNEIIKMLIAASLIHSFKQAENPLEDEVAIEEIRRKIGLAIEEPNRFYIESAPDYMLLTDEETSIMMPTKRFQKGVFASA